MLETIRTSQNVSFIIAAETSEQKDGIEAPRTIKTAGSWADKIHRAERQ